MSGRVSWTTCTTSRRRKLTNDFDILLEHQKLSEAVADDRVVVGQHYSDGLGLNSVPLSLEVGNDSPAFYMQ